MRKSRAAAPALTGKAPENGRGPVGGASILPFRDRVEMSDSFRMRRQEHDSRLKAVSLKSLTFEACEYCGRDANSHETRCYEEDRLRGIRP